MQEMWTQVFPTCRRLLGMPYIRHGMDRPHRGGRRDRDLHSRNCSTPKFRRAGNLHGRSGQTEARREGARMALRCETWSSEGWHESETCWEAIARRVKLRTRADPISE